MINKQIQTAVMKTVQEKLEKKDYSNMRNYDNSWFIDDNLVYSDYKNEKFYDYLEYMVDVTICPISKKIKYNIFDEFKEDKFLVYIIVVDGKIVNFRNQYANLDSADINKNWARTEKISKIKGLTKSFFKNCIENEFEIKFYGCKAEPIEYTYESFDGTIQKAIFSPYKKYQQILNNEIGDLKGNVNKL
jgi:hypothetical protein